MIIQIRGTSGSGKTWVVKEFMKGYDWEPEYRVGRKKPLLYRTYLNPDKSMIVLGHYEGACGGCDTIGSCPAIFELLGDYPEDEIVICEGLLLSEDFKWTSQIENEVVKIIYLQTPIGKCIKQIKARRKAAGNNKPLKEDNTRNRVAVIERSRKKLQECEHVILRRTVSRQAPKILKKWVEDG